MKEIEREELRFGAAEGEIAGGDAKPGHCHAVAKVKRIREEDFMVRLLFCGPSIVPVCDGEHEL